MPGKFVVLADLEGAAGVRSRRECYPNYPEFQEFGVPNMQGDANAAAGGLAEGGASEVVVVDGHLTGANLLSGQTEAPARLSKRTLAGELDEGGVAGVFLTGIHGKTGTPNSFSSTTIAPWVAARLDGDIIGDSLIVAHLCGAYDVPVVGLSGDWVACEELQWSLPGVPHAATKTGFDRSSVRHHDVAAARAAIREAGRRAASAPAPAPLRTKRQFKFELSFAADGEVEAAAAAVGSLATRRGRVLVHVGGDFRAAVDLAARAVGALYPGWVDGLGRRAVPDEPAGRTAGGLLPEAIIDRFYGPTAPYWSD
jgi:D-amino peptidase